MCGALASHTGGSRAGAWGGVSGMSGRPRAAAGRGEPNDARQQVSALVCTADGPPPRSAIAARLVAGKLSLSTGDTFVVARPRAKRLSDGTATGGARSHAYEGADRRNRNAAVRTDLPIGRVIRATAL